MQTAGYLKILKDEIHSVVFATADENGLPDSRVIDIMLADSDGLKKKTEWTRLLSGVPTGDYVFQEISYEEQIEKNMVKQHILDISHDRTREYEERRCA